MKKSLLLLFVASLISHFSYAEVDYDYKGVADFRMLDGFASVEDFEKSIEEYTQHCLDNTFGGTGGIPCFIHYEMWDRELNEHYQMLLEWLEPAGTELLKKSQRAWISERDKSIEFNSHLLDIKYAGTTGTMQSLMRAGDANEAIYPIVKERALVLQRWYMFIVLSEAS